MPLRSFNALAGEVRSDTFHLLQLTQLSSWRIAFGKWAATLALNALVAIGMLPFFVFRYFRGGVDLVPELLQLLVVASVGAVVAAFTVAFSAHQAFLVRALAFSVIGLGGGMAVFGLILDDSFTAFPLAAFAWFFVGASWLGAYGLLMAAEAIATGDENYALTKRTIAMTAIVVSVTVNVCLDWDPARTIMYEMIETFHLCFAAVFLFDSVTEAPRYGRGIVRRVLGIPVVRRFALLRVWLYPGWQSGHLFFLPVLGLLLAADYHQGSWEDDISTVYFILLLLAGFIFPTAVIQVHPTKFIDRFVGKYCLIATLMVVYASILVALSRGLMTGYDEGELSASTFFAAVLTPLSALLVGAQQYFTSDTDEQSVFFIGTCVALVWYLVLVLKGLLIVLWKLSLAASWPRATKPEAANQ